MLIRNIPQNIIFPFYHLVSDTTPLHIRALYKAKTIDEYRNDLKLLQKHFQPISIEEIFELQKLNKKAEKPSFYLSFDDGLSECYSSIAPILEELQIPASFFINPDFVDNNDMMFRYKQSLIISEMKGQNISQIENLKPNDILSYTFNENNELNHLAEKLGFKFEDYLRENKPYMTLHEIFELQNAGFSIGAHSMSHPLYENISETEQINQTIESVNWVQKQFSSEPKLFAFPFTDNGVRPSFFDAVQPKVDMCFTAAGIKDDIYSWVYNRFSMEKGKNPLQNQLLKYTLKDFTGMRNVNTHSY